MDIKKPSKHNAILTATTVGGAAVGAMLSEGVFSLLHNGTQDAIAGADNSKSIKRGVIAVGGGVLAAFVSGTDALSQAIKGAGLGMAVAQSVKLVSEIAAKSPMVQSYATGGKAKMFIAKSLGLNFSCDSAVALQGARRRHRALRAAEDVQFAEIMENSFQPQGLDAIFQSS